MTTTDDLAPCPGETLLDYTKRLDAKLNRDDAKREAAKRAFAAAYLDAGGDPRELEQRVADYFKKRDQRIDEEAREVTRRHFQSRF